MLNLYENPDFLAMFQVSQNLGHYRGNFKSPQKFLKFRIAILLRSVFGGYLFNSHAQTTASISSMLIFQIIFELLLQLPLSIFYCIFLIAYGKRL